MSESGWPADRFEHWRPHLASVACGVLGSVTEAEDAVQQAWSRLDRSDAAARRFAAYARPAVVNGTAGLLFGPREEPFAVLGFTVSGGRIAELDMVEPGA